MGYITNLVNIVHLVNNILYLLKNIHKKIPTHIFSIYTPRELPDSAEIKIKRDKRSQIPNNPENRVC